MSQVKCGICGKSFEVKECDAGRRKYCKSVKCNNELRRLAMQRYRQTERGRAMVELQNRRHKRAEREWECFVCKGKFMSAQKRNSCDVCIEKLIKKGVKKPELAVTMRKWRVRNGHKIRAYTLSEIRSDGLSRRKRQPCLVCDNPKTDQHHHDYSKPKDVTFLCKTHHHELHSWDSISHCI